jgi:hypothetical protein
MKYLLSFVLALSVPLSASVIADMTPDQVRAAIAFGISGKTAPPPYAIRQSGFVGSLYKPRLGYYSTPFLRVAQAAFAARLQYREFVVADVTPELVAAELHVYGLAQTVGAQVANVQGVVLTRKGQADAIRPTRVSDIPVEFRNLFGLQLAGTSVLAVFPLEALQPGTTIHILYDGPVHDGGATKFCQDCAVDVDLDHVR